MMGEELLFYERDWGVMKNRKCFVAFLAFVCLGLSACGAGMNSAVDGNGSEDEKVPTLATVARECDVHFFYKEDNGKWVLHTATDDEFDCVLKQGLPTEVADKITEAQSGSEKSHDTVEKGQYTYEWWISDDLTPSRINIDEK